MTDKPTPMPDEMERMDKIKMNDGMIEAAAALSIAIPYMQSPLALDIIEAIVEGKVPYVSYVTTNNT